MKIFGLGITELIMLVVFFIVIVIVIIVVAVVVNSSNKSRTQNPPRNNVRAVPTITTEQLSEYKKMLDEGIITQADFDEKKRQWVEGGR